MSSIFTEDISVQQLQLDYTSTEIFNSKDDANLKFFKKSGIYNSSIDEIKFFTNNIDALTIDNNQTIICNNLKSINSIVTSILSNNTDLNITTSDTNQIIFNIGANEKLRITSSGNVGIGTNNPSEKLDINGNINATEILKGGVNISNIFVTSNILQTNTTLNYNNLVNKPWINDSTNNNIYYTSGNVGIGTTIPLANVDIGLGTIKTTILSNNNDLNILTSTSNDCMV